MKLMPQRVAALALLCPFVFTSVASAQTSDVFDAPMPVATVQPLQPAPNVDQEFQSAPNQALPPGVIVGSPGAFVGISLKDAIAYALSNNTDLAISESNKRIAGFQIVRDIGPFDLKFQVSPSFNYTKIPALSPFQAGPNGGPTTQLTTGLQKRPQRKRR